MSHDNTADDSVESIMNVGTVRAHRLAEAGFETIADVANAQPADIAEACPFMGLKRAQQAKGNAQAQMNEMRAAEEDDADEQRVVILAGDGVWSDRSPSTVGKLIDAALNQFNIAPDVVGIPNSGNGASEVSDWWSRRSARGKLDASVEKRVFEPAWPDDRDGMTSSDWRKLFEARDEAMMMWATHVVVVEDGDYVGSTLRQAGDVGGPVIKTFIQKSDDKQAVMDEFVIEESIDEDAQQADDHAQFNQWDGDDDPNAGGRPGDQTLLSDAPPEER